MPAVRPFALAAGALTALSRPQYSPPPRVRLKEFGFFFGAGFFEGMKVTDFLAGPFFFVAGFFLGTADKVAFFLGAGLAFAFGCAFFLGGALDFDLALALAFGLVLFAGLACTEQKAGRHGGCRGGGRGGVRAGPTL